MHFTSIRTLYFAHAYQPHIMRRHPMFFHFIRLHNVQSDVLVLTLAGNERNQYKNRVTSITVNGLLP
jgi:hypothetical protein